MDGKLLNAKLAIDDTRRPIHLMTRQKNSSPHNNQYTNKLSVTSLTIILGCIYGIAFIMALSWIVWLWKRRKTRINSQSNYNATSNCKFI